jgi:four helix bundle protein
MAKAERFEDIKAWQKARELVKSIYRVSATGRFERDFVLRDQIRRAAVSVGANIAEGFERGGDREFLQFLSFSKGSCGEVRAHLYMAADQGYVPPGDLQALMDQALETSRIISGLMSYLKASELRGSKFK